MRYWPTPTAHNAKETNAPSELNRNTPTLAATVGGKLNPEWVELLMGWVKNWTKLEPIGTEEFFCYINGFSNNSYALSQGELRYGKLAWNNGSWESGVPRTSDGTPNRMERLKAIGNGQVPLCAFQAWEILIKETEIKI